MAKTKIDVAKVTPGEGEVYPGDEHGFAVYRKEDGSIVAMSTDCPHAHCDVAWNSSSKEWDCPCHGSRFDAEGKVLEGPAEEDLRKLEAKGEGDTIEIE